MTPEHWQTIIDLAEAAAALPNVQRAPFLDKACLGNEALRNEVDSLLSADEQSGEFIEAPVFRIAAELIAGDQTSSMVGEVIGAYQIVDLLGVGGMGEVYQAQDLRLGRTVALKFLPGYLTTDKGRIRRFEQEARAASALNHPNVVTVYDFGSAAGTQFIATEFVEGMTLRQHIESAELTVGDVLDIAIQVASALGVAHNAGIVHRDIKPENIMLRPDGYVKVLDFGLAKMTERRQPILNSNDLLESRSDTQTGLVLGTPHYMSPEQARGLKVDARTDLFGLGAVIYEMLTHRKPFDGETTSHVVVAILEKDPPPLSDVQPEVPSDLQDVVGRALQKDVQARYQTAGELIEDLRAVKRRLDIRVQSTDELKASALSAGERLIDKPAKMARSNGEAKQEAKTLRTNTGRRIGRHPKSSTFGALALAAVAAAASYFSAYENGKPISSVAILPFANVGSDSGVDYLTDGVTDYLTKRLSRLAALTVVSSRAASRYEPRDPNSALLDVRAVGHELNVQAVVVGTIVQQGNRIQIDVELVDARNNGRLWGAKYDRSALEILSVQEDIAKCISEKLRSGSTRKEENQLSKRYTENPEAYQLYLRGRHAWNKRTEPDLQKAIAFFDEAIGIDPQCSLAYAGLADSYQVLIFHGGLSPMEYYPEARAAAEKAIEIDDTLAEAHTALAYIKFYYEWDWSGAESEFKRAIELNPNYATGHQWYGEFLGRMGRADESLAERQKALRLDPLSPIITSELGFSYFEARRFDRAVEEFRKAAELYPDFAPAHDFLGSAYEQSGLYDQAIAEYRRSITLAGDDPTPVALARVYARSGKRNDAQRLLVEIAESPTHRYCPPTHMAMVYAALGDKDKAFEWLDRAYAQRHWGLAALKVFPEFDPLRSDPRFADMMKRMNFPQ